MSEGERQSIGFFPVSSYSLCYGSLYTAVPLQRTVGVQAQTTGKGHVEAILLSLAERVRSSSRAMDVARGVPVCLACAQSFVRISGF